MKNWKRTAVCYILLGALLLGLGAAEVVDSFWSGMGTALIFIGILRLIRTYRFRKDEAYREQMEIATSDERIRYIRQMAWSWTGYLFVIVTGIAVILLKIAGQELLSMAASGAVCLMAVLYWISYLVLQKKY